MVTSNAPFEPEIVKLNDFSGHHYAIHYHNCGLSSFSGSIRTYDLQAEWQYNWPLCHGDNIISFTLKQALTEWNCSMVVFEQKIHKLRGEKTDHYAMVTISYVNTNATYDKMALLPGSIWTKDLQVVCHNNLPLSHACLN